MTLDNLFSDWGGMLRILVTATAAYAILVAVLRVSGKRTLSKLNAFDLIVTIALGSTLASVITSDSLPLAEGLLALVLLVLFQLSVTSLSVRWPAFDRAIKSEPSLLLRDGRPIDSVLRRERITRDELLAAIRDAGARDLEDAEAVFLESDGSLTALLRR